MWVLFHWYCNTTVVHVACPAIYSVELQPREQFRFQIRDGVSWRIQGTGSDYILKDFTQRSSEAVLCSALRYQDWNGA